MFFDFWFVALTFVGLTFADLTGVQATSEVGDFDNAGTLVFSKIKALILL